MHFMPLVPRGRHFSSYLAFINPLVSSSTIIHVIVAAIFLSVTSVTARVIRHPDLAGSQLSHLSTNSHSSFEELQKQLIVNQFKKRIYEHMGWSERPRVKNINYFRELYRNEIEEFLNRTNQENGVPISHDASEDKKDAKVLTVRLVPSEKRLKVPITQNPAKSSSFSSLVHFSLPTHSSSELTNHQSSYHVHLQSAKLRMRFGHMRRRLLLTPSTKSRLLVKVYHVYDNHNPSSPTNSSSNSFLLQSFFVNSKKSSKTIKLNTESLSVLNPLFSNLSSNNNVLTFKITVTKMPSLFQDNFHSHRLTKLFNKLSKYSSASPSFIDIAPSLKINVSLQNDRPKSRSRRSTDCSDSNSKCCNRVPIYIDYKDIGLDDWALTYQGYLAYYCKGSCPLGYKPDKTFSRVKAQMHELDPDFPAPNCASSSYAPITLAHLGKDDNIEFTTFSDMIVTECKCY